MVQTFMPSESCREGAPTQKQQLSFLDIFMSENLWSNWGSQSGVDISIFRKLSDDILFYIFEHIPEVELISLEALSLESLKGYFESGKYKQK